MITWDLCTFTWITVSAIATLFMVFVTFAVFIRPWFRRPKFSIEYYTGGKFCHEAKSRSFLDQKTKVPTYWIRLGIRNTGKSVATRCLGKLVKVLDEHGEEKQKYDTMLLHWVITPWKEVSFRTIDLNRDENEYLNVLATQSNNTEVYFTGDQFPLAKRAKDEPRAIPNSLPRGKYVLVITVYGDDVKPETKYLSLIWQGDDMKHVCVKLHDDLQKAKCWLKKRELASAVGQPQPETGRLHLQDVSAEQYIVAQIQTYFIFGLLLTYLTASCEHIQGQLLFGFLATIALLWTFSLWLAAFNSWKKLEKAQTITTFIIRCIRKGYNKVFYAVASVNVLAVGFLQSWAELKGEDVSTQFLLFLFIPFFMLLALNIVFVYYSRSQQDRRIRAI